MMLAMDCAPEGAVINVFGFNWSKEHWDVHQMDAEEKFAVFLAKMGRIVVHPTACRGLRFCGQCTVVGATAGSAYLCSEEDMESSTGGDSQNATPNDGGSWGKD
jgi:hypothetical protein